jgi:putative AlgH/UPF0301 family transcriptional regulator
VQARRAFQETRTHIFKTRPMKSIRSSKHSIAYVIFGRPRRVDSSAHGSKIPPVATFDSPYSLRSRLTFVFQCTRLLNSFSSGGLEISTIARSLGRSRSSSEAWDWDDDDLGDVCWLDKCEVHSTRSSSKFRPSNKCQPVHQTPRTSHQEAPFQSPSSGGGSAPQVPKTPPSGYALSDWRTFRARLVSLEASQTEGQAQLFLPGVEDLKSSEGDFEASSVLSKKPSTSQAPSPTPRPKAKQARPKKQDPATVQPSQARSLSPQKQQKPCLLGLGPGSWAHLITYPEPGCLLLAKGGPGEMAFFDRAVILVTSHDEAKGSVGFVLNKPSPMRVSDLQLASECPGFIESFGGQRLQIGGPAHLDHATVLHRFVGLQGSTQVSDRLFTGGLPDALKLVQAGLAKPHDFNLVLGMSGWGPKQLINEVNNGMWHCVAASPDLVLPRRAPVSSSRAGDPHDTQVASAAAMAIKEGQDMWTRIMNIVAK